jgi:hypothetical protein
MKRSIVIGKGIYQFEFLDYKIAVAKWDEPPRSTPQWVNICPDDDIGMAKYNYFYLQGTNIQDICVVPVPDDEA